VGNADWLHAAAPEKARNWLWQLDGSG